MISEEVLKYLSPHIRLISFLTINKKGKGLIKMAEKIKDGLKNGKIIFDDEIDVLNIDLKDITKEKGIEWASEMKRQLELIVQTIEKISKNL